MKKKLLIGGLALLVALILFSAIGFFAIPALIKSQAEKYVREDLKRELTIGEVRMNPFDLAIEIKDLALKDTDGSPLMGFKRLLVDYEIFPAVFDRAYGWREISLTQPITNLVIDQSGSLNFARLITDITKDRPKEEKKESQALPRLIIAKLAIDDAGFELTDHRRAGPFHTSVEPLDLLLTNFNTLPNQEGRQTIVASTPEGEELEWVGRISVQPLQSEGTIQLTQLSGPKIWRYFQEMLNFEIPSGTADFSTAYVFEYREPEIQLRLTDMKVDLRNWALKSRNKADRVLALKEVHVGAGQFDLAKREVTIDKVLFQSGSFGVQRGSDNLINWVELLKLKGAPAGKDAAADAQEKKPAEAEGPWKIALREVRLSDFGVAFSDESAVTPYDLTIAKTGFGFGATIDYSPAGSEIKVNGLTLALADIALKPHTEPAPILTVATVDLGEGTFDYKDKALRFDALKVAKPRVEAWLDKDRKVNWLDLGPRTSAAAPAEASAAPGAAASSEQPWKFSIHSIDLSDGAVAVTDRAFDKPVTVNIEPIRAQLQGASSDLAKPVAYDLSIGVKQGGLLTSKGNFVPATPSAEGTLALEDLSLKPAEIYVNRFARLVLVSGAVSTGGRYAFAIKDGKPAALYAGSAQVTKLNLIEEDTRERFLAWDLMDVSGINFKLEPSRLDIAEIRFDRPGGKFILYEDQTTNVMRILRTEGKSAPAPVSSDVADAAKKKPRSRAAGDGVDPSRPVGLDSQTSSVRFGAQPAPAKGKAAPEAPASGPGGLPFPINIQRIRVNKGELFFADLTLTPQFGTRIHTLNGTVNSLSSRRNSKAQMKLEGAVDEYGLARFDGDLSPFAPTDYMNITATFRNVELTSMTPYSAKFAGYRIASGKLSADLKYFVQQRQLKGDNHVVIDQLTLGERVESPTAVKIPLELAIALLKDADGRIDLGLPVSGSLDDPQFSLGGLIWKVVVNVLTKIVTAPFRALGALLGVEGDKLEAVDFDAGSDRMLPPEKEKLKQVATALEKRPQLKLGVKPAYTVQDAEAIKSLRVRRELASRAGFKLQEGEDPGPIDTTDPKNQAEIAKLFTERFGKDEYGKVIDDAEKAAAGEGKEVTRELRKQARAPAADAMFEKLVEHEQVSDEDLKALAQRRAEAVKQEFEAQGALAMDRFVIEPPEKVDAAEGKLTPMKFTLAP